MFDTFGAIGYLLFGLFLINKIYRKVRLLFKIKNILLRILSFALSALLVIKAGIFINVSKSIENTVGLVFIVVYVVPAVFGLLGKGNKTSPFD